MCISRLSLKILLTASIIINVFLVIMYLNHNDGCKYNFGVYDNFMKGSEVH